MDKFPFLVVDKFVQARIRGLQLVDVLQGTLILALQISMQGMHVIQLLFKFKSQLHLLFMSFNLLREFFFEFLAQELFLLFLFLQLILPLSEMIQGPFQVSLLLGCPQFLLIELFLNVLDHVFVFFVKFGDEHLVVRFTAVLQEDGEDPPKRG